MDSISRIAGLSPGTQTDPLLRREESQTSQASQIQDEAPRQKSDTVTLRGKAYSKEAEDMDFSEAQALLERITSSSDSLLAAHSALSPASVARLLEMDAA